MAGPIPDLKEKCRERGLVLTHQRHCVYDALMTMKGHPDARAVYRKTARKVPTISLNTVYSALAWLEANGFVRSVPAPFDSKKFDTVCAPHDHIHCVKCGSVMDLPREGEVAVPEDIRKIHTVLDAGVTITVICGKCRN